MVKGVLTLSLCVGMFEQGYVYVLRRLERGRLLRRNPGLGDDLPALLQEREADPAPAGGPWTYQVPHSRL